jgi:hypothetical protein
MALLLTLIIIIFIILELSNVLALYFRPGTTQANAVGVFTAWEKSKADPEIHSFVKYLVWWVAGVKLIFISLLVVIVFYADPITQSFSVLALAVSTMSFFGKLFPLIRQMDRDSQLTKKGYSRTLGAMVLFLVLLFILAYLNEIYGWIV